MSTDDLYKIYLERYKRLVNDIKQSDKSLDQYSFSKVLNSLVSKDMNDIAAIDDDIMSREEIIKTLCISCFTEENFNKVDFNKKSKSVLSNREELNKLISDVSFKECPVSENMYNSLRSTFRVGALKRFEQDILSGKAFNLNRYSFVLDNDLFACTDVGNTRTKQDDSFVVMKHPGNKDFVFMMVADGVGSLENSNQTSYLIASVLLSWFKDLDKNLYNNPNEVLSRFADKIHQINDYLYENEFDQSTLSGCIVCKDKTVIASIGDSRIYTIRKENKSNTIRLETDDESLAQHQYDNNELNGIEFEELRFLESSYSIYNYMSNRNLVLKQIGTIDNDYNSILICSDGLSDSLYTYDILKTIIKSKSKNVCEELVDKSKESVLASSKFDTVIKGGSDNSTAVLYKRK